MSNKPYELVHNQNQYVYVPTCTQSFNTSSLDCLFVIIQLHTYLPKNITLLRVYIIAKKPRQIIKNPNNNGLCILFFQSLDRTKGRDELVFSSLDVLQLPKKQADAKIIESSTYNHK